MTSLVDAISTYIYPPEKYEFVRLDHHPNYILGKIKAMFQSTNQIWKVRTFFSSWESDMWQLAAMFLSPVDL
jgi:hypothetical protein